MADKDIPRIEYTKEENEVWKYCYPRLMSLMKTNACKEFNYTIECMEKNVGLNENAIPQLDDISKFL